MSGAQGRKVRKAAVGPTDEVRHVQPFPTRIMNAPVRAETLSEAGYERATSSWRAQDSLLTRRVVELRLTIDYRRMERAMSLSFEECRTILDQFKQAHPPVKIRSQVHGVKVVFRDGQPIIVVLVEDDAKQRALQTVLPADFNCQLQDRQQL
jgi:hypothetical protein